ncbi:MULTISPECIES: phage terminase large subunit [unclassified Mesorhizobium]|uniref:phage terminase large subunit n=1 Tax=unclassified Mesorhizobium TaxID=325217 RepID=UPI001FE1C769|nr:MULTISPECIES: phage terminase large subunit [unclassified Mesorhizobium]
MAQKSAAARAPLIAPDLEDLLIERDRRKAKGSFAEFVKMAWLELEPETPLVWNWHMQVVCDHLQALVEGKFLELGLRNRLVINVPPGTSKSLLVSVLLQAWEWGPAGRPGMRYLSTAYNDGPVNRDTRKCRDLILSRWYQDRWPEVYLSRRAETSFANNSTGTREGVAFGSLTSQRGDRLIIDDPHSTETAESATERTATTRKFREGAQNRLNDQKRSVIIVIMQRLHEADVTGVILDGKMDYVHLCLPMQFEPDRCCYTPVKVSSSVGEPILARYDASKQHWYGKNDNLPDERRAEIEAIKLQLVWRQDPRTVDGEILDPIRFPPDELKQLYNDMTSYAVAGQYQQRPAPRAGGMFQRAWFEGRIVRAAPKGTTWVRHWDLAGTRGGTGARTAGVKLGRDPEGRYYVGHVVTLREEGKSVRKTIETQAALDGKTVHISLPQDPGQAGKAQVQDFVAQLAGYKVHAEGETGDKVTRAEPFAAQCEHGNVYIVEGEWNTLYLDELCLFPASKLMDQVDASSGAFTRLLNIKGAMVISDDVLRRAAQPGPR